MQATFAVGLMLAEGRGVAKDRKTAADMFEKAALTGHAEANYNLGLLFLKGDGKPKNPIRAVPAYPLRCRERHSRKRSTISQRSISTDAGVEANALEAARWLSRAAEQGLAVAQYDYAVMLLQGFGLTKDEPKIGVLMKAAAEKGIPGAQNRMAYIFREGVETEKNPVEAAKWRLIARTNGFKDATLDEMVAKLPKADRQKAEAEASAWADRIQVEPCLPPQ